MLPAILIGVFFLLQSDGRYLLVELQEEGVVKEHKQIKRSGLVSFRTLGKNPSFQGRNIDQSSDKRIKELCQIADCTKPNSAKLCPDQCNKANSKPDANVATTGPCKNACKGAVSETCVMSCEFSGKCTETIKTEKGGCDGSSTFSAISTSFQGGKITSGVNGAGELGTCNDLDSRCTKCVSSPTAYSANSWKKRSGLC